MAEPFLSEIRVFSFSFAPVHWALCNGQLLSINQNQALYALLGTTYGGNGSTDFALPDFRGRMPVHPGAGRMLGETGGAPSHTLSQDEIPVHTHALQTAATRESPEPAGRLWAPSEAAPYHSGTPDVAMAASSAVGGSQPHNNMQPYLVLNFCIALQGIFPTQN